MKLQTVGKQEDGRYESTTQGFKLDYVGCTMHMPVHMPRTYGCVDDMCVSKIYLCQRYIC
jgi:hypothetical protein